MMERQTRILLVEPFFTGSHKAWAEGWQKHSKHDIRLLSLSGKYWKWRMHGGAVALTSLWSAWQDDWQPDWLIASDMLDLGLFASLNRHRLGQTKTAVYFHENQLTYPWSPTDQDIDLQRDRHYGFMNYSSALVADKVLFNSPYHQQSFLNALPPFLSAFPDHQGLETVKIIQNKSDVLPLGLDLQRFDNQQASSSKSKHLLLWNHRWEYDKNPEGFFNLIEGLLKKGFDFEIAVLGEGYARKPKVFEKAKQAFSKQIRHWGYAPEFATYAQLLWEATLLPVTSVQDFFGISIVEAMYCQCRPLLPKRLAYPMHIPENLHSQHFYENPENLLEMASEILSKPPLPCPSAQDWVKQYDWERMKGRYDGIFVVENK